eukprot:TRINITY_DN38740_c0_g1_i4.p1 TRINITY_DN38740_c0_g1~~TRINITY_DN38740_c0_g1_i4.p1  ORF type:complete len:454 (+),score=92.51 TRINITY_DN38740_c0_g1_i4:79-1440(+)
MSDGFNKLDGDKSGALGRSEIRAALTARHLPCAEKDLDAFFRAADSNADGEVSRPEFAAFCAAREKELRRLYDILDANGDGRLTSDELRCGAHKLGFKISSEELRTFMERADVNNDGVISFHEFKDMLQLLPECNPCAMFEAVSAMTVDCAMSEYALPQEVAAESEPGKAAPPAWSQLAAQLSSGGVAGAVSRTCTAPFDRVRLMMQTESASAGSTVGSSLRAIAAEGAMAFFRGNGVNCLKIAPETAIKFVAFDHLKSLVAKDPHNITVMERFVAGGSAGALAQAAIYPLEICRTRLATAPQGTYTGAFHCLQSIVRKEGFRHLYQGLGTSVVGMVPYAGMDLAVYSMLKEVVSKQCGDKKEPGVTLVLGCGMVSSTVALVGTYPIGLVRTKLQVSGMPGAPSFSGPVDALIKTVRAGGVRGLYKGIVPTMMKVVPSASISFAVYDVLSKQG